MPDTVDLGAGLQAVATSTSFDVHVPDGAVTFRFDRRDGHVRIRLRYGSRHVHVDVTIQPSTVVHELDEQARLHDVDPNRWRLGLLRGLRGWDDTLDGFDDRPAELVWALGILGHRLLGAVHHARPDLVALGEIPRWASTVLQASDAARAAAGLTERPTRRLTRSLAASLVAGAPSGPVELRPLAAAVIGHGLVRPDELANVLDARPVDAGMPPLPSTDEMRMARHGLEVLTIGRRAALLVDVVEHHDLRQFAATMTQLWWIRDVVRRPLPQRLAELTALCARHVVAVPSASVAPASAASAAPAAAAASAPPRVVARADRTPRPAPGERWDRPAAPVVAGTGPGQDRVEVAFAPTQQWMDQLGPRAPRPARRAPVAVRQPRAAPDGARLHPGEWPVPAGLRRIDGYRRDGLTFSVPTSTGELVGWAGALHNCLDGFAAAVFHERSWLIGVERDGRLIGCVEVVPGTRQVRQALGPANQPLTDDVWQTVIATLHDTGVVTRPN